MSNTVSFVLGFAILGLAFMFWFWFVSTKSPFLEFEKTISRMRWVTVEEMIKYGYDKKSVILWLMVLLSQRQLRLEVIEEIVGEEKGEFLLIGPNTENAENFRFQYLGSPQFIIDRGSGGRRQGGPGNT